MRNAREIIINEIKNDMDIFRWLEVGNKDAIKAVRSKYDFKERDFLTSIADSTITKEFVSEFEGGWVRSDSLVVMYYYSESPLCQYIILDEDKNEVNRMMTNIRFANTDGHLYIEEFNPEHGTISSGEILKHTEDELHIRNIENSQPDDKGTVRIYTKKKTEAD